jgi:hypothetical protein
MPRRQLAQLLQRVGQLGEGRVDGRRGHAVVGDLAAGEPQMERQRDEPLLGAVVQVTLQAPALRVADLDQPQARGADLLDPRAQLRLQPLVLEAEGGGGGRAADELGLRAQRVVVDEGGHPVPVEVDLRERPPGPGLREPHRPAVAVDPEAVLGQPVGDRQGVVAQVVGQHVTDLFRRRAEHDAREPSPQLPETVDDEREQEQRRAGGQEAHHGHGRRHPDRDVRPFGRHPDRDGEQGDRHGGRRDHDHERRHACGELGQEERDALPRHQAVDPRAQLAPVQPPRPRSPWRARDLDVEQPAGQPTLDLAAVIQATSVAARIGRPTPTTISPNPAERPTALPTSQTRPDGNASSRYSSRRAARPNGGRASHGLVHAARLRRTRRRATAIGPFWPTAAAGAVAGPTPGGEAGRTIRAARAARRLLRSARRSGEAGARPARSRHCEERPRPSGRRFESGHPPSPRSPPRGEGGTMSRIRLTALAVSAAVTSLAPATAQADARAGLRVTTVSRQLLQVDAIGASRSWRDTNGLTYALPKDRALGQLVTGTALFGRHLGVASTPLGPFVQNIAGVAAPEKGFWALFVNNTFATVGARDIELDRGDEVSGSSIRTTRGPARTSSTSTSSPAAAGRPRSASRASPRPATATPPARRAGPRSPSAATATPSVARASCACRCGAGSRSPPAPPSVERFPRSWCSASADRRRPVRTTRTRAWLLLVALVLAGCGEEKLRPPPPAAAPAARLVVTEGFGSRLVRDARVAPAQSVMDALRGVAEVRTAYQGSYVQSIDGTAGSLAGGRDWFYFVNGIAADMGADEFVLRDGDETWWDYRRWGRYQSVPVVVGSWPEAVRARLPRPATGRLGRRAARRPAARRRGAGRGRRGDERLALARRVGADADLRRSDPAWRRAVADPGRSGLTAWIDGDAVRVWNAAGQAEAVAEATAVVAAVQVGDSTGSGALLVVSGTRRRGGPRRGGGAGRRSGARPPTLRGGARRHADGWSPWAAWDASEPVSPDLPPSAVLPLAVGLATLAFLHDHPLVLGATAAQRCSWRGAPRHAPGVAVTIGAVGAVLVAL